jgi:hypothetical protein
MAFNIKIFLLCPIPEEQKPVKRLINLKENYFTNLLTLSNKDFFRKIFFNFFYYFLTLSVIRITEFNYYFFNLNWFLTNIEISLICITFSLYFIFNQWNSLLQSFNSSRIFYEEASWFDGQIWDKPFSIIRNDRLILNQQIKPLVRRTINLLTFLIFFIFIIFLSLQLLKIY